MNRSLLVLALTALGTTSANSFTGFDAQSAALGNTGVAAAAIPNASFFNPALLASHPEDFRFAMTLPSIRAYINDSTGLIADISELDEEGGTIDQFESIDIERFNHAVFGDGTQPELSQLLRDIADNIDNTNALLENYIDNSDFDALLSESNDLTQNTNMLSERTDIALAESNKLEGVAISTRDKALELDRRALSAGVGGTALEVAFPVGTLTMGLQLRTDVTAGAQLFIERNDFRQVDNAIEDLTALSNRADSFSESMVTVADRNEALVEWIGQRDNIDTNDQTQVSEWVMVLNARLVALEVAQDEAQARFDELAGYEGQYYNVDGNGELNIEQIDTDNLESELEVVGANITELGFTIAHNLTYQNQSFSAGITPKLLNVNVFERRFDINDDFNDITGIIEESTRSYFAANLDIGVGKEWEDIWYGDVRAGLTIKDIIPLDFKTDLGNTLKMRPKVRAGAAHLGKWTTVAVDLDITENKPMSYGVATRYLGLGAEYNAFDWFKLRAGYRNNLSVSGAHAITTGIGFTPWGVGLDLGAWFTPAAFENWEKLVRDAGVTAQFSMTF